MMSQPEYVTIHVSYVGMPADRFDRSYYATGICPLVIDAWGPSGLLKAEAFLPAAAEMPSDAAATIAICECVFRDEAALAAAFASERTPQVMADVQAFTDLAPRRSRSLPLE
jgi:uncharacterized protein (TIGR02118 family)